MRQFTRHLVLLAFALGVLGAAPAAARAGFILSSEPVTAAPGSTGYVQILLQNDSVTTQTLSGFSADITLGGTGVRFTGVDGQTTPGYVFDGFGTGTLTFDTFTNQGFNLSDVISDFTRNPDGFVTLAAGQTVGLGRIAFEVDGTAAGGLRPITFTAGPTTVFTDGAGNPYPASDLSFSNGGITVQGSVTVVPGPSSTTLLAVGAGCALIVSRRRRQPVPS